MSGRFYKLDHIGARILASGSYVPARVVRNAEIAGLEESDEQIQRLLGAVERRAAGDDEACSDLIVRAAERILADAGVSPADLDRIVVSATPGDFHEPSTASVVQHKLRAECPAVDIGMSCVGWVAGVDYALRCLATGDRRILVMGGTVVSRGLPYRNPMHRAIFGDGAGGLLLGADGRGSFLSGMLWTQGEYYDAINLPHVGSLHPPGIPDEYRGGFFMGSRDVFFQVLQQNLGGVIDGVLAAAGRTRSDVDAAVIHQPSRPLYEQAVRASGLPREKLIEHYEQYGNTISAELALCFDEGTKTDRIRRGDTILMVTFGAGFSGGALVFEY